AIAPGFGGINLEDISSPRCFEIEDRLVSELDIPVFHDDQHGTAIVVLASLLNACRLTGRRVEDLSATMVGAGAAGIAVAKIVMIAGIKSIVACDRGGMINCKREEYIIPSVFNNDVCPAVARAVAEEAQREGMARTGPHLAPSA